MDTRMVVLLFWCTYSPKLLNSVVFDGSNKSNSNNNEIAADEVNSMHVDENIWNAKTIQTLILSGTDAEVTTKSSPTPKISFDREGDFQQIARSNLVRHLRDTHSADDADDDDDDGHLRRHTLDDDDVKEGIPLTSQHSIKIDDDENDGGDKDGDSNGDGVSNGEGDGDGILNDSPMTKYGSSYPYPTPPRRQSPEKLMYTKEIMLKQGRLKGIVRSMHPQTGLRDVDQYLGLPYAEAPVGSRRFMPPGTPLPWQGLKIARHLPSVCPQKIPDISNGSVKMSKGRYEQLIRLLPYLKTENEDCLYLNVYVPSGDGIDHIHKYPVIVYLHGESFEWNSGNPYDGSVLASYGQVIVVTVNYRLGVLGFMRPGINDDTVSNFGLLDQIAALHWIKENIEVFGGDKNSVTLMGHSTGAVCVNYLMVSPVASGLFHRAILMSGSAMSDWAASNNSLQLTMQIAHKLNCPLNDGNEELLTCLRLKRYEDIQKIPTAFSQFSTSLGPIVDGNVIPNQPYKDMSQYTELFSRYDLLFGMTEVESYHTLNAPQLEDGIQEQERDNLLRFYMQSRFDIRPDLALAATLKKYTDMYNNPIKASSLEHRDVVLDILSDARVVGPLIQTGLFHADVNPRNYMYVFGHNSAAGPHSNLPHSITGEELAFVFGAPLAPAGPFHNKYNAQEKLLSEAVMSYWTNFAKTGNPKAPWKGTFINLHALEWDRYDLDWPEFNKRNQCYINIGIPPSIGYKYRYEYMNYWNKELPNELNQIGNIQQQPYIHTFSNLPNQVSRSGTSIFPNEVVNGRMSKFPPSHTDHNTDDPQRTLRLLLQKSHPSAITKETADNMYNAPPTFGVVYREKQDEETLTTTLSTIISTQSSDDKEVAKSESTMHLLIGLIAVFIVLNVIIYSTFLIQKKKKHTIMGRKLGILSYDGTTDDELKRSKNNDGEDSYVLDMVRKSNTYEAVKTNHSPINGFKITRQLSSSTMDAHTKVCDWMSQENAAKSSPKSSKRSSSPTFSFRSKNFFKRPEKVSVAIDATPQARSNSVLRQEPIEVTKLKSDNPRNLIICQEVDVDTDLITEDSIDSSCFNTSASASFSMLAQQTNPAATIDATTGDISSAEEQGLRIDHKHSRSDPVDMYYSVHGHDEKVTSFINEDINVTCREPNSAEKYPLTQEQQIYAIKRRNFPKVLPNYPCDSFGNQIVAQTTAASLAATVPGTNDRQSNNFKRNSLPPNSFTPNQMGKMPPMPPPRTISTLGRRPPSLRRQSHSITTSPVMLAKDCSEEEEPEITQNTLIVGPIIPKNLESNYSTVSKKKPSHLGLEPGRISKNCTSASAPVTPSSVDHADPLSEGKLNAQRQSGIRQSGMVSLPSSSSTSVCSTFQPTTHASHHTEATYTIQPRVTDLTPLVIKQSMQAMSAMDKSNIPRVHMTSGGSTPPSIRKTTTPTTPTAAAAAGSVSGNCGSVGGYASRIPQKRGNPTHIPSSTSNSSSSLQGTTDLPNNTQQATPAAATISAAAASLENSKQQSSSSSVNSSSSSSDDTSSSTGTVRTELKQK
ncbi:uncharacterized protein LOC129940280 [Eupeodes corollae]|uniref:uncharacterized protein LOC129940280 n=1 Tax=Eupeodes corollae TaxID=290404 RepID=UPI00248FF237|nr:uncharacterized protein LOC129940280 [Eupeodes corollae]